MKNKNEINARRSEVKMAIRYKSDHMYLISEKESRFKSRLDKKYFLSFAKLDKLVLCLNSRGSALYSEYSYLMDGLYPILGCIFLFNIQISSFCLMGTNMMYTNTCKIIIKVGWVQFIKTFIYEG